MPNYTIPPDNRAAGSGVPAADIDAVADVLSRITGITPGNTVPQSQASIWATGWYDPRGYGAVGDGVTDDTAAIQAAINAMPSGGAVCNLGGAPVSYLISAPVVLKTNASYIGSWLNTTSPAVKSDITCSASFSGLAALIDVNAAGVSSSSFAGNPITVFGVSIDMTSVTGTTSDAIRLMTFGGWVYFCEIRFPPANGIHFTDANAGGFAIANTAVENRACFNSVSKAGNCGILVDNFTSALTDGYICDNIIRHRSINIGGDAANSTGAAIDLEYSANWQVRANHVYAVPGDAIVVRNAWGMFCDNNNIDHFGLAGAASTTYHGLYFPNGLTGPPTHIGHNTIWMEENYGSATTTYQYLYIGVSGTSVTSAELAGNVMWQKTSSSSASVAKTFAGGTGTLNLIESGTQVVGAATSPTLSASNTISGTVNLVHPGATALNSGSTSIPVGLSSVYGAMTNLIVPPVSGTGFAFMGCANVYGGTITGETVNVQYTATWDDGTTSAQALTGQTVTGTVNVTTPSMLNMYKNGRNMVKLAVQARTTAASTAATVSVTAIAVAG